MNELFDKLIVRVFFALIVCCLIYCYKLAHNLLYPSARRQLIKQIDPTKNPIDTIHIFSRLLGLGLIFTEFHFIMSQGIIFAIADFFIQAILIFVMYLATIYIMESIVLYNFVYADEVTKRKSYPYAIICFAHSLGIAYVLKVVLSVAKDSIPLTILLWLFAVVIIGFSVKTFKILSKLSFNRLMIQKSLSIGLSYFGFFWGWIIMIASALNHPILNLKWYAVQTILNILLCLIIFPIFRFGIIWIYKIKEDFEMSDQKATGTDNEVYELGYGIYEGSLFLVCAFLTTVITGQIHFGTFYPVF